MSGALNGVSIVVFSEWQQRNHEERKRSPLAKFIFAERVISRTKARRFIAIAETTERRADGRQDFANSFRLRNGANE